MSNNHSGTVAIRKAESEIAPPRIIDELEDPLRQVLVRQYPALETADSAYQRFSEANFENARNYYLALEVAKTHRRNEQITLFAGAIVDLYQKDRADRASSCVGGDVKPTRNETLPLRSVIAGQTYQLSLTPVNAFDFQIPHTVLAGIAILYQKSQDAPDALMLARYVAMRDPMLFAQYGTWYVKLAQWT